MSAAAAPRLRLPAEAPSRSPDMATAEGQHQKRAIHCCCHPWLVVLQVVVVVVVVVVVLNDSRRVRVCQGTCSMKKADEFSGPVTSGVRLPGRLRQPTPP